MNIERGFKRVTWVVSGSLFAVGTVFAGLLAWEELDRWSSSGEPLPKGDAAVYIFERSVVTFPEDIAEAELKAALDGPSEVHSQVVLAEPKRKKSDASKDPIDLDAPDIVSFVYIPASGSTPSVLYSRKALLHTEARGGLTAELKAALETLRHQHMFPGPVTRPFSGYVWNSLLVAVGAGAVPWGVFFLIRWIVQGFRGD